MSKEQLTEESLRQIQKLIEANYSGCDELRAAAETLDDDVRQHVCDRLARLLAQHAEELQHIVATSGVEPAGTLDLKSIASALFDLAKANCGARGVLDVAAEGEQNLKRDYDQAIDATSDRDTRRVLRRQRDEVEFGEHVLRGMEESQEEPDPPQDSTR